MRDGAAAESEATGWEAYARQRGWETGASVCCEEVHAADGRALPLTGITCAALQQVAVDPRLDDQQLLQVANHLRSPCTLSFTTEQTCQHILKAVGMPPGWTDLVYPVPDTPYSTHRFRNDTTESSQDRAPPGTRSVAEVIRESNPASVGQSNRFISHFWQMEFRSVVSAVARREEHECEAGVSGPLYFWFDVISLDEHHAEDYAKGFNNMFMDAAN